MAESALIVYVIGLALTVPVAWSLGANDASNPTECAVGSGIISLRKALILFAVFAAAGALLQGYMVMKTMDRGIVPHISLLGAFTVVVSICIWLVLCTWKGLPISTTHTTVGSVIGYGLAAHGAANLNWSVLSSFFISIVASPVLSIGLAILLYFGFKLLLGRISVNVRMVERVSAYLLVAALVFSAYSFGANDIANATGVFITVTKATLGMPDVQTMMLLAGLGSAGIAWGGFTWGYRVIETAARRITRITPITGIAAEYANALTVFLFTTVPYMLYGWGMPISTTHSSIGAIIGVGLVTGVKTIDRRTVGKIVAVWALTMPCVILISWFTFTLASIYIPL